MSEEKLNYGQKNDSLQMKPLEEMDVIDNFLFTAMAYDEETGGEVCRMILEPVLKRKVGKIHFTAQKVVPGVSETGHGIRMDAFIMEDDDGTGMTDADVYDIEPDKNESQKRFLPKRVRYYGDLIDVQLLSTGTDYDQLPKLVMVFILSYDPFGQNAMYYEAGTVLKTHPVVPYDDGIRRIYLYTGGDLPKNADKYDIDLQKLLKYIAKSTAENITDDTTKRLDEIVKSTKKKKAIGVKYMKSWERERELIEEVRREEREKVVAAEQRADNAEARADTAEAKLAKYIEKYGDVI
ncbi:MAG: hypothetical protein J5829_08365 [Lachnospiraceae bacterium]|nr:hypothetical protein [Lachnospiraceae bacterium]